MAPLTVLYADDDAVGRRLVRHVLEGAGYAVLDAVDGLEAVQLAQREQPDLVILDWEMPGLDGLGVTRALKALPTTNTLPVLLLTGHTDSVASYEASNAGCDGYLSKPVQPQALLEWVAEFLGPAA